MKKKQSQRPPPSSVPASTPTLSAEAARIHDYLHTLAADEEGFESLDRQALQDADLLRSADLRELTRRWKGLPGFDGDSADEWRSSLTESVVAEQTAAIAALMRNALLMGFASVEEAHGRVGSAEGAAFFELVPQPGSLLAQEHKLRAGQKVQYRSGDFAQQIAQRCHVSPEVGALTWRALVLCLREHACSALLPGLQLSLQNREIGVRLQAETTAAC